MKIISESIETPANIAKSIDNYEKGHKMNSKSQNAYKNSRASMKSKRVKQKIHENLSKIEQKIIATTSNCNTHGKHNAN